MSGRDSDAGEGAEPEEGDRERAEAGGRERPGTGDDGAERDRGDDGEGGYVHDPTSFDGGGERTTAAYLDGEGDGDADWRAWLLVGATFAAFLVVPAVILFLPAARPAIAALGLSYRDAYLVLPLLPAIGLASLAVWAGVANRRDR